MCVPDVIGTLAVWRQNKQKKIIEFVLVETNKLVGSNPHVILTWQTCGQRSSRVAGSKRLALAFYFSVRIWYMLSISKCRGKSNLGLCMTLVLAKRIRLRSANFERILRPSTFLIETRHPAAAFSGFLHVPKLCADLDPTLLYISIRCIMILGTHSKFTEKK